MMQRRSRAVKVNFCNYCLQIRTRRECDQIVVPPHPDIAGELFWRESPTLRVEVLARLDDNAAVQLWRLDLRPRSATTCVAHTHCDVLRLRLSAFPVTVLAPGARSVPQSAQPKRLLRAG